MGVVRKNTLGRFIEKLQKINNYNLDRDKIISDVAQIGKDIADSEYAGTGVEVNAVADSEGVTINARGKEIAYMEFGTGVHGEGSYQGVLPDESYVLEFESPEGVERETQGWVYDYMKKLYEPSKESFQGQAAQAQMFNTAQRLKTELGSEIAKKIKGE